MRSINVEKIIDDSKFNRFHGIVLFWCTFIMIFDGYDLVVYGSIMPILIEEWSLSASQSGILGSAALIGMMLGALFLGSISDKIGRKKVILFCVALFSLFTIFCGLASGPMEFGIYRFIAGVGLGGIMPNIVTLMSEYAPKPLKSTLVSLMFSGYAVGGMLSAGLSIILISSLGWQYVFFVGGLPLLTLPIMYMYLPESPRFIVSKEPTQKIKDLLKKINPSFVAQESDHYTMSSPDNNKKENAVINLFKEGRGFSTVMIWIAFFMCLLMIYGLNTWLPQLMINAGYPITSSVLFLVVLNFGAIFGAVIGGRISDRWNAKKVLILFFVFAAASLIFLGFGGNIILVYALVGLCGATTVGTQILANAYASQYYPTNIRSSGVGWALGIGRLGAIVGPLMGSALVAFEFTVFQNFIAFAIPAMIAGFCIWMVKDSASKQTQEALSFSEADEKN